MLSCSVARVPPGAGLPLRPLAAIGVLFALVLVEPDFGTSVVLVAGAAGVLWSSELRTSDLVLSAVAALVALAGVMWLAPYRRERFMAFLDPWTVADGSGYQVVQSMVAIKAGGFFGSGAGAGAQGPAVPELGTDMIFALIGEELGLFGMVGVIAAFGFITLRGVPDIAPRTVRHGPVHGRRPDHDARRAGDLQHRGRHGRPPARRDDVAVYQLRGFEPAGLLRRRGHSVQDIGGQ